MHKETQTLLSISYTYQLISFALYINDELIDWGTKTFKEKKSENKEQLKYKYVRDLIHRHGVTNVLCKKPKRVKSVLISKLKSFAFRNQTELTLTLYTNTQLCKVFRQKNKLLNMANSSVTECLNIIPNEKKYYKQQVESILAAECYIRKTI